jgi:hypothetical protein
MSKKRRLTLTLIMTAIIMISIILVAQFATTVVSDVITVIVAIFGFLAILYQMRMDYKIKRAEFIYSLNSSFTTDLQILEIYMKFKENRDNKGLVLTAEDGRKMGNYVMFFKILNYLLDQNLVDLSLIDNIFSNKFFLLCNNKYAQEFQLKHTDISIPIINLYEQWYNHRLKNNLDEPYPEHSFSNYSDFFIFVQGGYIEFNKKLSHIAYKSSKSAESKHN